MVNFLKKLVSALLSLDMRTVSNEAFLDHIFKKAEHYTRKVPFRALIASTVVTGVAIGGYTTVYHVNEGSKCVIFDTLNYQVVDVLNPGFHLKMPFKRPIIINVQSLPYKVEDILVASKDLQLIKLSFEVQCRPDEDKLNKLVISYGERRQLEKSIDSLLVEIAKYAVASQNAITLLAPTRGEIVADIKQRLEQHIANLDMPLLIDELKISKVTFGVKFIAAYEAELGPLADEYK